MRTSSRGLRRLGIGGTAVGSGLNAHPEFARRMVGALRELTGVEVHPSENLFESMQSMADFVDFSASMRTLAVTVTKIANDLRLLASGPTTGLNEIILPAVQPGSSIMPGKVNPVMAEMVNMVMFQVVGCDTTIMMASQAGQLELNVMMPVIAHNLLEMMDLISHSLSAFDDKCIQGIIANAEKIQSWLDQNPILITALNPIIGYQAGAKLVKKAIEAKLPVRAFILEEVRNLRLIDKKTGKPVSEDEYRAILKTLFG
jgi:fumarate hydratase class II